MKVSFIKYKDDKNSYKIAKMFGLDVYEINEPEEIDKQIEKLKNEEYKTIFIPNNLASFSDNIIKKYQDNDDIKIILTPTKENKV